MARQVRIICFLFAVGMVWPLAANGLERSSKRDCAICHIMWLNDFRTDEETLVDWQPGNVLMQDTQGVVSSEAICYSCHDGYVNDSRARLWKDKNHTTFRKPSPNVTVPDALPLSVKGELYCGTCHSPHGIGAAPEGSPLGFTSFFREKNVDSQLCERCHTGLGAYQQVNGHPVNVAKGQMPVALSKMGSKAASQPNKIICQTCHQVHGAHGETILVVDNRGAALCTACHVKQQTVIGTAHDLTRTLAKSKNSKGQTPARSGACGACHIVHRSGDSRLWARPLASGHPASQLCLSCHDRTSGLKTTRIGTYTHPFNTKLSSGQVASDDLPLYGAGLATDTNGRVHCMTCHDVHQWDPRHENVRGRSSADGDGTNSFLRIKTSETSALCVRCHADKRTLLDSDHNLVLTGAEQKNMQERTPAASGPCGACHVPHNALGKKLWARKIPAGKADATIFCTGCHSAGMAASAKTIGLNDHPLNVPPLTATENVLPLYDHQGHAAEGGRLSCLTCHEPHRWRPDSAVKSTYAGKNIEGDGATSFLRITNAPSSGLCQACHLPQAQVKGTDHDLIKIAPDAKNVRGQTVFASGACGACHLAHNSPHAFKLWARSLGPSAANANLIDRLCTECHSNTGVASKKIPAITSHPAGVLMNNRMRFKKNEGGYSPLFDSSGKEVNVGDIACATCHNTHQRGNARITGGRFLRTPSHQSLCADCHGPDALYRYMYFHNPNKRLSTIKP